MIAPFDEDDRRLREIDEFVWNASCPDGLVAERAAKAAPQELEARLAALEAQIRR